MTALAGRASRSSIASVCWSAARKLRRRRPLAGAEELERFLREYEERTGDREGEAMEGVGQRVAVHFPRVGVKRVVASCLGTRPLKAG